MAFEAGNVSVSPPQIFAAFHLAAKTLLEGMELEGKPKEDIVKLSVDSSVVSSATVFVAVDEVTQEPIEGAVKVFDLHTSEGAVFDSISHLVQQQQQIQALMATNIDCMVERGGGLLTLTAQAEDLSNSSTQFSKAASRRRGSAGKAVGSIGSALGSAASRVGSAMSSWFGRRANSADEDPKGQVDRPEQLNVKSEEKDEEEDDEYTSPMSVADDVADPEPHPLNIVVRAPLLAPSLSALVALQLANGSWSLTGALSSELGKELKVIEDSCPSGCPSAVWATALALSSLKLTYSSQQDEWELVAKKAEAWLKKQSLPTDLTLQTVHSEAEKFL